MYKKKKLKKKNRTPYIRINWYSQNTLSEITSLFTTSETKVQSVACSGGRVVVTSPDTCFEYVLCVNTGEHAYEYDIMWFYLYTGDSDVV